MNSGTVQQAGVILSNGVINNSGTFNITPTGKVASQGRVSNPSQYTQTAGNTIVNGRLEQGIIDIQGGTLSGNGIVNSFYSPLTVGPGATIRPGDLGIGTLNVLGDLDCNGCTLTIDIDGTGNVDILDIAGHASLLNAFIQFDFMNGFIPKKGDAFDFLFASNIDFTGIQFGFSGLARGFDFKISNTLNSLSFITTQSSVPEPPILFLIFLGLVALNYSGIRIKKPVYQYSS